MTHDAENYDSYEEVQEWLREDRDNDESIEYLVREVVKIKERVSRLEGR